MINRKGTIAISQIVILLVSIIAITFLIGASMPVVSAGGESCVSDTDCTLPGEICLGDICGEIPFSGGGGGTFGGGGAGGSWDDGGGKTCSVSLGGSCKSTCSDSDTDMGAWLDCKSPQKCCVPDNEPEPGFEKWMNGILDAGKARVIDKTIKWTKTEAQKLLEKKALEKTVQSVGEGAVEKGASKLATFFDSSIGGILTSAAAAFATAILIDQTMNWVGASERNGRGVSTTAYIAAGGASIFTTILVLSAGSMTGAGAATGIAALTAAIGVGTGGLALVAAAIVLLAAGVFAAGTWQDYSQEIFVYEVHQWQPVDKGEDCEQCNDLEYGCSEYQCRSYGKGCALINEGTTDQMCFWENKGEFNPPQIYPLESALISEDYNYEPLANIPPERGTKITYEGGCVPAFTSLVLGVRTNELTQCKIDMTRKDEYDPMLSFMAEGTSYLYEHTLSLPSSLTPTRYAAEAANMSIQNGGIYDYFIRCKDANGRLSRYNFQMNFCVDDGPDMNEPIIIKSNYPRVGDVDVGYIRFNTSKAPLNIYTNEPATCKWDYQDLTYDQMKNDFDNCSQSIEDYKFPSTLEYGCKGYVEGIKSRETNDFYVRCRDKPLWTENDEGRQIENKRSYPIYLVGTEPIIIDSVTVNGRENGSILKDSKSIVDIFLEVKTLGGAEEGQTRCEYKFKNNPYVYFSNNRSFEYFLTNTQELNLPEGEYTIPIKCFDLGKNLAYYDLQFTVDVDLEAPVLARAYHEEGYLKLITTEEAECVYMANEGCTYDFKDGSAIQSSETNLDHFVTWDTNSDMFVKCKDEYGNQPSIGACSIIVRAFERDDQI